MQINIYEFQNFREYLKKYYEMEKSKNSTFSYKKFARLAQLGSPNYLKYIIDGQRNLTISGIHKFAKAMTLTYQEKIFFELLVLKTQAKSNLEKSYYSTRISEEKSRNPQIETKKIKSTEILSHPLATAVLLSVNGADCNSVEDEIKQKIGIPFKEAKRILDSALAQGLIIKDKEKFKMTDRLMVFLDPTSKNFKQKQYLDSQISLSQRAFRNLYEKGAKFYSHTFTVGEGDLQNHSDRISGFLDDLMHSCDQEKPEKIVQLNLQFFQITNDLVKERA